MSLTRSTGAMTVRDKVAANIPATASRHSKLVSMTVVGSLLLLVVGGSVVDDVTVVVAAMVETATQHTRFVNDGIEQHSSTRSKQLVLSQTSLLQVTTLSVFRFRRRSSCRPVPT